MLDLSHDDKKEAWQQVVNGCRRARHKRMGDALLDAFESANCVTGPVSNNATRIDTDKQLPRATTFQQWAFKESKFARDLFDDIIGSGAVHVIRIMHESDSEWDSVPRKN